MADIVMTPVRMPEWLRDVTKKAAANSGTSLNKFMVAALARATADTMSSTEPEPGGATFEATVRFQVASEKNADEAAYEVLDRLTSSAHTTNATVLNTGVLRLAPMHGRDRHE